ncbi:UNVERIFIED_CONTAM: putative clathrin assembly protein [Sesamum angustifolium]|uniref:Clathrin assembly protein n=1 Tax=Sesamum angustifolium TaxID=2727405 RepID=A0AAW2M6T6_9LAMI
MWPFNAFIRAYYSFLIRIAVICQQAEDQATGHGCLHALVLDVMDGLIIEIYDLYSKICRGIAIVLLNIYSGGKAEASMALNVVQKAIQHGDDLSYYFEFCQKIGVVYASQFPVYRSDTRRGN